MRLLIVTQVVDEKDLYLGFFTEWIRSLAGRFGTVEVICLKEGVHTLPDNVRVYSLGKERGAGRLEYVVRFYRLIWSLRGSYDIVFVHMNQEYVLLGGWLFTLMRKPLYFWRNHYAGSLWTALAASFCKKVFYTSKHSYTARFKKSIRMPVGVDTDRFFSDDSVRSERSILFFGRFAPSKRPDSFVEALRILKKRGVTFTAAIVGSALPVDAAFAAKVRTLAHEGGLDDVLSFYDGVPNADAPAVFAQFDVFVDLGSSGMYNKTIFEAASCGCIVLAASKDYQEALGSDFGFHEDDPDELAHRIEVVLNYEADERAHIRERLRDFVDDNSLRALTVALARELKR